MNIDTGRILLYPTKTVIEGYNEYNSRIEAPLRVWDEVRHCYSTELYIKEEDKNRISIPNAYSIKNLLNYYSTYEVVDMRPEIDLALKELNAKYEINMKYDYKNDLQRRAVAFLKKGRPYRRMQAYLSLNTGSGKTYCTVRYISDTKSRPIIFVDQESLGQQWINRIQEYTDTLPEEIFYISGQQSINKLMNMTNEKIMHIKFFICCYRTLTNNLKINASSREVSNLIKQIKVNLKVYDEAHIEWVSIFKMDMIANLRTIYLSATPMRSDPKEDKVYQNMFFMVDKFSNDNNKENYHNIIEYKWSSNPTTKDTVDCQTKYGFSMAKYCNYLESKKYEPFEELLYDLIFNFCLKDRRKKKMAILFGTNKLLDRFYDNLKSYCNTMNYKLVIGKFNGTIKKEDKMNELNNSDIIITTDKSFSKGMDVANLQILINTVPFSSETKLIQTIGRLRPLSDKEVIFFDINDIGFKNIKYQLKNKEDKVYKVIGKNLFIKTKK